MSSLEKKIEKHIDVISIIILIMIVLGTLFIIIDKKPEDKDSLSPLMITGIVFLSIGGIPIVIALLYYLISYTKIRK